ncbi:olfactory receptor 5AP2-like [Gastrophryne carolinensis]
MKFINITDEAFNAVKEELRVLRLTTKQNRYALDMMLHPNEVLCRYLLLYFHSSNCRKKRNPMISNNRTHVSIFELTGLTDDKKLIPFLFVFFSVAYATTIIGNVGMMVLIHVAPSLRTPMYYFLNYLSLVDLIYSSTIAPKIIFDLISVKKSISFIGCAFQVYFYAALAGVEVMLLSSMSYDRYAAICHPLHYGSIMTKKKCVVLVLLSFSVGFIQSAVQTGCLFSLEYCGPNLLDHFYCEIPPVLKLSCSETHRCDIVTFIFVGTLGMCSLGAILASYTFIMSTIMKMKSVEGRVKAFSTCSSHLICSSIYFLTIFFIYLRPDTRALNKQDKVASVFYSVVTPMLNPLIYSLRNQEVKRNILQTIKKWFTLPPRYTTRSKLMDIHADEQARLARIQKYYVAATKVDLLVDLEDRFGKAAEMPGKQTQRGIMAEIPNRSERYPKVLTFHPNISVTTVLYALDCFKLWSMLFDKATMEAADPVVLTWDSLKPLQQQLADAILFS